MAPSRRTNFILRGLQGYTVHDLHPSPFYAPTPAFAQATLANLAATAPAEVAICKINLFSSAKEYPGNNPNNIRTLHQK